MPPWPQSGSGTFPRQLASSDLTGLALYLHERYEIPVRHSQVQAPLEFVAGRYRFHPIRQWLESLPSPPPGAADPLLLAELRIRHADRYLHHGRRPDQPHAGHRPIYEPGCQADHLLIHGPQGIFKTTVVLMLAPNRAWVREDLPTNAMDRERPGEALVGKWIIELPELRFIRKAGGTAEAKGYLSQREDSFRRAYGGGFHESYPRSCVFVGTTNHQRFLNDVTGDRRFWPVHCPQRANLHWLITHRERLWAEARDAYKRGEPRFLAPAEEVLAKLQQAARREPHPLRGAPSRLPRDARRSDHRAVPGVPRAHDHR